MQMPRSQWVGLDRIRNEFNQFQFAGSKTQSKFLDLIGKQAVFLLQQNTPKDSGELANSWRIMNKSTNMIEVGTDQVDLVEALVQGSPPHIIEPKDKSVLRFEKDGQEIFAARVFHPGIPRNPFLDGVASVLSRIIIDTLERAISQQHPYFASLRGIGGKGRRFQQVGRTSAGLTGGITFAGRATLVRAGTGRRQLKRRLQLRRRRGGRTKFENIVKLG